MATGKVVKQFVGFSGSAQSDRTTVATINRYMALAKGGITFNPSWNMKDVDTIHKRRGVRYKVPVGRNAEGGQIVTPLYPDDVNYILRQLIQPSNDSDGDIDYFTLEHWWQDAIGSGSYKGRRLVGCLFTGLQMAIDRRNPAELSVTIPGFANDFIPLTSAPPTPTFSSSIADGPYVGTDVIVDWNIQDAYVTTGFTGDEAVLRSLSLNLDRAVAITDHKPDPGGVARRHMTWSNFTMGNPTLTLEATLAFASTASGNEDLMEYFEDASAKQGSVRIMAAHSRSASLVGATIPTAATPGAKTVSSVGTVSADPSGNYPALNDYVLIKDTVGSNIEVAKLTAVTGTWPGITSIQFTTTLPHDTGATVNIYDKAWEIRIPQLTISSSQLAEDGDDLVVNLSAQATLSDSDVDIWDVTRSYDD